MAINGKPAQRAAARHWRHLGDLIAASSLRPEAWVFQSRAKIACKLAVHWNLAPCDRQFDNNKVRAIGRRFYSGLKFEPVLRRDCRERRLAFGRQSANPPRYNKARENGANLLLCQSKFQNQQRSNRRLRWHNCGPALPQRPCAQKVADRQADLVRSNRRPLWEFRARSVLEFWRKPASSRRK